jgi:hypothetical protein
VYWDVVLVIKAVTALAPPPRLTAILALELLAIPALQVIKAATALAPPR